MVQMVHYRFQLLRCPAKDFKMVFLMLEERMAPAYSVWLPVFYRGLARAL